MYTDNQFQRERNNGKIIRACDTEATPGGGVQYHKCYDQDGKHMHRFVKSTNVRTRVCDGYEIEQKMRKSKGYFQVCQNADFLLRPRTMATMSGLGTEAGFWEKKNKAYVFIKSDPH